MDVVQWIGFFISVMAMFFLLSRGKQQRHAEENPEAIEQARRDKEKHLRRMLKSLDIDVEDDEEEKIPAKPSRRSPQVNTIAPVVKPPMPTVNARIESSQPAKRKSQRKVAIVQQRGASRGKKLLQHIHSPKDMIILRELIGPPKGSQPIISHEYWG